jgi:hypothetical protein
LEELILALHTHSVFSDGNGTHAEIGKAALLAGIDALIVTDHNVWVEGCEKYFQDGRKKVLMLIGEEVHDPTLKNGCNHMLIFGADRELSPYYNDPQQLIDQANRNGGLTFIAHPVEDELLRFGEKAFPWINWEIKNFTGIELWNQMSEFKSRSTKLWKAVLHAVSPKYLSQGPLIRTLSLWDNLLSRGKPVVAVGGVDAHELKKSLGPINLTLYPYEFQFRTLNTHLITPTSLSGNLADDKRMILDALRSGHAFVAYDLPYSTRGFRFTADNRSGEFIMGDNVSTQGGITFQVRLPIRSHCRLLKDGKLIKETIDREVLTHITSEKGIYRSEVYIDYLGKERGWIFSNPIYALE